MGRATVIKTGGQTMLYTWNGNDGSYTDATQWTPQDVPLYGGGASALIQSGIVTLTDTRPNDITITLSGQAAANQPNLVLDNAALGPGVFLTLIPPNVFTQGRGFATITVEGYDTIEGRIWLGGRQVPQDTLTISIAPYGQLNQEGTITVLDGSTLRVSGTGDAPAILNNDGVINIGGGSAVITADVIGSGSMALLSTTSFSPSLELSGSVAATQHVSFDDPNRAASKENLRLDNPSTFHGIIDGFNNSTVGYDSITLANTQATSAYFAQVTPDAGVLLLLDSQEVVAALTLTGTAAANAYGVTNNSDGSTTVGGVYLVPTS